MSEDARPDDDRSIVGLILISAALVLYMLYRWITAPFRRLWRRLVR